jgi:hypothetical protein
MPINTQQDERAGVIRPTLFIGLGGTGKEVLLRLRRKFYERFGEPGLPCVAYLWMDTDTRDHMAQGEPMDEIFRSVTFQDHEHIPLLQGKVKDHLGSVFTNRGQWEHIHRWMYREVGVYGLEIGDGAGGVRAVGRLTFFYHYKNPRTNIYQRISMALQKISTHEVRDRVKSLIGGAEPDETPQVFLVSSLAGGTGCGTILDTMFCLRKISTEEMGLDKIIAVLFLPNVYYPTADGELAQRSYGNAYAALKELEFYTLRREIVQEGENERGLSSEFVVEWEKNHVEQIPGPPTSVTYLLERRNEGAIGLETRSELFYMVAESLFLDFMPGEFSTAKRSQYSNVTTYISSPTVWNFPLAEVILPQSFARRYASFGMSKIEIPTDALRNACASQLAYDIVSYWNRATTDPDIMSTVNDAMAEKKFNTDGIYQRFGDDWKETIKTEISGVFRGLVLKETRHVDELLAKLESFETKVLREAGNDPTRWGKVISSIRSSTDPVVVKLRSDLKEWVKTCLDEESRGLKALLGKNGYLAHLITKMKEYYTPLEEGQKAIIDLKLEEAAKKIDYYKKQKDDLVREMKAALRSPAVSVLMLKDWTLDVLLDRLKFAEEQYALARGDRCLWDEAKTVAERAVKYLEEVQGDLKEFQESLDSLTQTLDKRKKEFLNFSEGVLFIRLYDEENDWPQFYALGQDREGKHQPVNPRSESSEFLKSLGKELSTGTTMWELIEYFQNEREEGLRAKLIRFAENRFRADFATYPRQVNVLNHPELKRKMNEYASKLVISALPMTQRDDNLGGQSVEVQRLAYLGIAQTDREPYRGFITKVKDILSSRGFRLFNALPTGVPSEIYLYLVSYAFALPSITTIREQCHKAYYDFYESLKGRQTVGKNQIPLHLSNQWDGLFDDLIIYNQQQAEEIKDALEILLFGSILRVVEMVQTNGRIEYQYEQKVGAFAKSQPLGVRRDAIEFLRRQSTLRRDMKGIVRRREESLSPKELSNYFWILNYLLYSHVIKEESPESFLIQRKLEKVESDIASKGGGTIGLVKVEKQKQLEYAKEQFQTEAEWIGDFPVLKNLEVWVAGA